MHTARVVQKRFRERKDLQLLNWLSKTSDLNPIENIGANIINNWEPEEERTPAEVLALTRRQWELLTNREPVVRDIVSSVAID